MANSSEYGLRRSLREMAWRRRLLLDGPQSFVVRFAGGVTPNEVRQFVSLAAWSVSLRARFCRFFGLNLLGEERDLFPLCVNELFLSLSF